MLLIQGTIIALLLEKKCFLINNIRQKLIVGYEHEKSTL